MPPLKIALLSRWYWEENRRSGTVEGGTTQQLAEAVAALGHEVVVLSQSPEVNALEKSRIGALEAWLSPREKKRDFFTGLRDKWAKPTYHHRKVYSDAFDLRDFLTQRGPFDVLWAQCEEPDGLVAGIARQIDIALPPMLVQIFALRYQLETGSPIFSEKPALRIAFRHADRILANSEMVAGYLSAYADDDLPLAELKAKTHILPHNLQREFLRAAGKTDGSQPSEPDRVLFLGALNEKKGAAIFMDAVRRTEAAKRGAVFAVIGDFTEKNPSFQARWKETLEATQSQLSRSQIELLGKVAPGEALRQILRASVVVLPSLFDEFSRALVEALVLGRPVVTTDKVGAWPLVKTHACGLVIPANDSAVLAWAIDDVLNPEAPYARNAQKIAPGLLDEFSPEALARQMAHHLAEITKSSTP